MLKKLLSTVMALSMLLTGVQAYAADKFDADTAPYGSLISYGDFENKTIGTWGLGDAPPSDCTMTIDTEEYWDGAKSLKISDFGNGSTFNVGFDVNYKSEEEATVTFEAGEIYHLSFWLKQESADADYPDGLWSGLTVQNFAGNALVNDEDYYRYVFNGGASAGKLSIARHSDWQYKSIVFVAGNTVANPRLYMTGVHSANENASTPKINLWIDNLTIRKVPNPEKYTVDGASILNHTNKVAPYTSADYRDSRNKSATAQEDVISQITLKSYSMDDEYINLVFNDEIGTAMGVSGVEKGFFNKDVCFDVVTTITPNLSVEGVRVTGAPTAMIDAEAKTTTVKIPYTAENDPTLPISMTVNHVSDIWGKHIDMNADGKPGAVTLTFPSIEQAKAYGNLLLNAGCESLDFWGKVQGTTLELDTSVKNSGNASIKAGGVATPEYPLNQDFTTYLPYDKDIVFKANVMSDIDGVGITYGLVINYIEDDASKSKVIYLGYGLPVTKGEFSETMIKFNMATKWADYANIDESNVTGYQLFSMRGDSTGSDATIWFDDMYLGVIPSDLTVESRGAFCSVDKETGAEKLILAFKANKDMGKPIVDAGGIDADEIIFDAEFSDLALSEVVTGTPTVTYSGYNTFVTYDIELDEIYDSLPFAVKVTGVYNVYGGDIASFMVDTQKAYSDNVLVAYKTAHFIDGAWSDGTVYGAIYDDANIALDEAVSNRSRFNLLVYNPTEAAVTPVCYVAYYDEDGKLLKVGTRTLSSVEPGEITYTQDTSDVNSGKFIDILNTDKDAATSIYSMWWTAGNNVPCAPKMLIK
ncbi:MAG: hypothetical protein J6C82_08125 [Clostridia bacterium]|nr:hypothetical protein [Clostridia bacterium]MBP3360221.1 hypothetical protein [Clostridia bacterium]